MKFKAWVVCQAVKKEFKGIKSLRDENTGVFFLSKEAAYTALADVIANIKHEMSTGLRKENTLNPDEWLDFAVSEVEIDVSEEKMIQKGWRIPKNPII